MSYTPLIDEEFDELVLGSELTVIVYVTLDHCRISARARAEFTAIEGRFRDHVTVYDVDADVEKALVFRLNIKAVPTLLVFSSGNEVAALLGFYHRDELQKRLGSIIRDSG